MAIRIGFSQGEDELLKGNELPARPQLDGILNSNGTYFALNNSTYLDIILESSDPIELTLRSVPEMVTMRIEPILGSTSTQITLHGLVPLTTYHKYEDDYHNLTVFTADANGDYTYLQDLTRQHFVFIIPGSGSKFTTSSTMSTDVKYIKDDATGGDCTSIGNWKSSTKTCMAFFNDGFL
ncbi:MAG: hypothetical protein K8R25_10165 [Methanosarcinales archaeon]|nr:hypothetical protein [Methanosarcinales archaeon]